MSNLFYNTTVTANRPGQANKVTMANQRVQWVWQLGPNFEFTPAGVRIIAVLKADPQVDLRAGDVITIVQQDGFTTVQEPAVYMCQEVLHIGGPGGEYAQKYAKMVGSYGSS